MFDKIESDLVQVRNQCKQFKIDLKLNNSHFVESSDDSLVHSFSHLIPSEANHGDLVVIGEKNMRSKNVYFVNCIVSKSDNSSKPMVSKTLARKDTGASGYGCVPIDVTCRIKNPLVFYENAFTFDNYDEIDFSGIEIDTEFHQEVIQKFTNGKPVDWERKCFYFFSFNEWNTSGGMFIWCDFFLDDFDMGRYLKLTPHIDDAFLGRSPPNIRDAQIFADSIEMKRRYEKDFTNLFYSIDKGTDVEVYGLTFFCPKSQEPCGGNIFTMLLNRIEIEIYNSRKESPHVDSSEVEEDSAEPERNYSISAIILNKKESVDNKNEDDDDHDDDNVDSAEEFRFTAKVLTQYGRFGNVKLWSIENSNILNSPFDKKQTNTFVLFSTDLFF
jgi:hypothetical protein